MPEFTDAANLDGVSYDTGKDELVVFGKRYSLDMFRRGGFLGPKGTLLQVAGDPTDETVTLTTLFQPPPADPVLLLPCPFCGGPPCVLVQNDTASRGEADFLDDYGADGLYVLAFVFCHECGAKGPAHEDLIFDRSDYIAAEAQGVYLWQARTTKNSDLYEAGVPEGLNHYPRKDSDDV